MKGKQSMTVYGSWPRTLDDPFYLSFIYIITDRNNYFNWSFGLFFPLTH